MDPTPDHRRRADALRRAIRRRTGIRPGDLECPRERGPMTPCVARDGSLALVRTAHLGPICVGCEIGLGKLERLEAEKSGRSD